MDLVSGLVIVLCIALACACLAFSAYHVVKGWREARNERNSLVDKVMADKERSRERWGDTVKYLSDTFVREVKASQDKFLRALSRHRKVMGQMGLAEDLEREPGDDDRKDKVG